MSSPTPATQPEPPSPTVPRWHYTRAGERLGPVSLPELLSLQSTAQLLPTDLLWREGMPDWLPVSSIPELGGTAPTPPAPPAPPAPAVPSAAVAPASPAPLAAPAVANYYRAPDALPAWAAATFKGYAPPTGDSATWPVDEPGAQLFIATLAYRKKITAAANLFKGLGALTAIAAVIMALAAVAALLSPRGTSPSVLGFVELILVAVCAGITTLYLLAFRATWRCRRWAPLTLGIFFSFSALSNLALTVMIFSANTRNNEPAIIGNISGFFFTLVFAYYAFRAYTTIPKYLAQPAWCQELLIRAKL